MEIETYRVGGDRFRLYLGAIGMPCSIICMIPVFAYGLSSLPNARLILILLGLFGPLLVMFFCFFLVNYIWERRKKLALSGIKRMARIIKVFKKYHSSNNATSDYYRRSSGYYTFFMIVEYKSEDMKTVRSIIEIEFEQYVRIQRPCDILVHVKGNFAYVNWYENPQFLDPQRNFKS